MTAVKRDRMVAFLLAVLCLFVGSAIYILFRPTTLLMFHWADAIDIMHCISPWRAMVSSVEEFLPRWFVFSVPFALWVLAYLFLVIALWEKSQCWIGAMWFWFLPIIASCAELAQMKGIVPGTFDWGDFAAIIIATILGCCTRSVMKAKEGKTER
jgi:hypothetical protein